MQMVKVVLPKMLDKKKGVIVNLSSSAGSLMLPMMTVYASTKVNVIFLSISIILDSGDSVFIIVFFCRVLLTPSPLVSVRNTPEEASSYRSVHE